MTLVSNLALGAETTVVAGGSNPKYASSFTTGSADGYGLASVALRLTSAGGSPTLDVAVHRDSSGVPGQRLFALDNPPPTTDCEAEGAVSAPGTAESCPTAWRSPCRGRKGRPAPPGRSEQPKTILNFKGKLLH